MATTEDARAGWELYLNSGFSLRYEEINDRLKTLGYAPVADRTWRHYQSLRRRGFRRYITINRLDTMSVPDPYVDESIRTRYRSSSASVPAQVVIHSGEDQVEVVAVADALSDFGAELVVSAPDQVEAIRACSFEYRSPVAVNFLDPVATVYGHLDFVFSVDPEIVRIGVAFKHLIPVTRFAARQVLEADRFLFVVGSDLRKPSLDEVSQDIYWLFNLVEATRAIINGLLTSYGSDDLYVAPPTVDHLQVSSPLRGWIAVNASVYLAIQQTLARLQETVDKGGKVVRAWTRSEVHAAEARRTLAEAEVLHAQADLLRMSKAERELVLDVQETFVHEIVKPVIRRAGRQARQDPDFNLDAFAKLVLNDLVPAITEMRGRGLTAAPEAVEADEAH